MAAMAKAAMQVQVLPHYTQPSRQNAGLATYHPSPLPSTRGMLPKNKAGSVLHSVFNTMNTPTPTEEELKQSEEIVIGILAYTLANQGKFKIESVEQYAELHDKLCRNGTPATAEAMKTEEGTMERLREVNEVWTAGVNCLISRHHKLSDTDRSFLATGLRTMRLVIEALLGNIALLKNPDIRERITKPSK